MGHKQPNHITRTLWVIKYAVASWLEWQDAKVWAKEVHPAWLQIATYSHNNNARQCYKQKILITYRESGNI